MMKLKRAGLILVVCVAVFAVAVWAQTVKPDDYYQNFHILGTAYVGTLDLTTALAATEISTDIARAADVPNVSLAGTPDYITLGAGQVITRNKIDLTSAADVTGLLPDANIVSAIARDTELHAAVTLAGTLDYLTMTGQAITRGAIDLATDVTGVLPLAGLSTSGASDNFVPVYDVVNGTIQWEASPGVASILASANEFTALNTFRDEDTGATANSDARVVIEGEGTDLFLQFLADATAAEQVNPGILFGYPTDGDQGWIKYLLPINAASDAMTFGVADTTRLTLSETLATFAVPITSNGVVTGTQFLGASAANTIAKLRDAKALEVQNNAGASVAEINASGNLQLDGTLSADGTGTHYVMGMLGIGDSTPTRMIDITASGDGFINVDAGEDAGFIMDRGSTTYYSGNTFRTGGGNKWFIGMPTGGADDRFIIGSGSASTDAVILIESGTNDVTFADDVNITSDGAVLTVGTGADNGTVSAGVFTDRTAGLPVDMSDDDALNALSEMRSVDGQIDHESLPDFVRTTITLQANPSSATEIEVPGRDLGKCITLLMHAAKRIRVRLIEINGLLDTARDEIISLRQRVSALENQATVLAAQNAALQDELDATQASATQAIQNLTQRVKALETLHK